MPRYQLKNDGTGDKVQILRWTLTTVHSFALIRANTAGWEGGLQGKNFSNITTARKRGHARLIFSLLAQPGSIQIWKKSSEIDQIEQVIMSEKRRREIWKIFSNSSEVSGQKLCFFFWCTVTLLSKSYLLVSKPRFSTHFLDWPSTPIIKLIKAPLVQLWERGGELVPGWGGSTLVSVCDSCRPHLVRCD